MLFQELKDLVDYRAREDGEKIFLIAPDDGKSLSFLEFKRTVDRISRVLRNNGLRQGEKTAIVLPNGFRSAAAFFSVTGAGGVAVPVNPKLKAKEMEYILNDSDSRYILAPDDWNPGFARLNLLEDLGEGLALFGFSGREGPDANPKDADVALLLYTSGTTGHPKGVLLSHRNLIAEAAHISEAHRLGKEDVALCVLPLHHINGLAITLITPLYSGGQLVIPGRFSAGRFWGRVRTYGATWFSAVPTILSILLSRTEERNLDLPRLRFARSASAALPEAVLKEFETRFGVPVIESYGISEGASQITTNPLPPRKRKVRSVGIPFGNEIRVVNPQGAPLPPNAVGEVIVKGENVSRGYYKNPEETGRAFVGGWFHTGDLGYLDEEGYLFLSGRIKEMINRAGEKFSPREIDEALYLLPEVELAAAVGVPDELYGEEVVAFVKPRPGASLSEEKILTFCRQRLADFKVPKRILFTDDFPKGPSGKIQRMKLAERYRAPAPLVTLDPEACKECGYCAMVCPKDLFRRGETFNEKGYQAYQVVNPEKCIGCWQCFFACPDFAIDLTERDVKSR